MRAAFLYLFCGGYEKTLLVHITVVIKSATQQYGRESTPVLHYCTMNITNNVLVCARSSEMQRGERGADGARVASRATVGKTALRVELVFLPHFCPR